jgi:hypothetical protein
LVDLSEALNFSYIWSQTDVTARRGDPAAMRVHIVGSKPDEMDVSSFGRMKAACREIGAALADRDHDVSVGSVGLTTADRYVLEGYLEKRTDKTVCVHLL